MSQHPITLTEDWADYLRDESRRTGFADQILFARSAADAQSALRTGLPITLQGARTGITGGAVPEGGLALNFSRMNRIGAVHDQRLRVEPGAQLCDIQTAAAAAGLFFPPDPTEHSASIGGMLACNASGARSYHYGPTRNWIHALRILLANGEILNLKRGQAATGRKIDLRTESGQRICTTLPAIEQPAVKNAAGYFIRPDMDLLDLWIGMEGTLGIILEAELQLLPRPSDPQALCAFFPEEANALHFVNALRSTLSPVAIEFFGRHALELVAQSEALHPPIPPRATAAIYAEFHRDADESILCAAEQMEALGANTDECWIADTPRELERHKAFRHATPEAVNQRIDRRRKRCPALTKLGTDLSVTDRALGPLLKRYRADMEAAELEHVIFGHIGDNHLHVNILPRDTADLVRGQQLHRQWAEFVVAQGGSVSAEHGIGKSKRPLLQLMLGDEGIAALRAVKQHFDPEGILNPGNLF